MGMDCREAHPEHLPTMARLRPADGLVESVVVKRR